MRVDIGSFPKPRIPVKAVSRRRKSRGGKHLRKNRNGIIVFGRFGTIWDVGSIRGQHDAAGSFGGKV